MTTIKLVILQNHPLKDGSFKIRVAVSHKHKTSYITTRYKVERANQKEMEDFIKQYKEAEEYLKNNE